MFAHALTLALLASTALAIPATGTQTPPQGFVAVHRGDQLQASYRQTNRHAILQRATLKAKRAARRAALGLGKRQASAPVFAQCSGVSPAALEQKATGFASISGYAVPRGTQDIVSGAPLLRCCIGYSQVLMSRTAGWRASRRPPSARRCVRTTMVRHPLTHADQALG